MIRQTFFIHRTSIIRLCALLMIASSLFAGQFAARAADSCTTATEAGCSFGLPTFQYQLLLSQMLAHPSPNVRQLQTDPDELNQYSFNRLVGGATPLYSSPGGPQIDTLDAGFNYVTILNRQGDYAEVLPGKWTDNRYLVPARASDYAGVQVDTPLAYPMAWVLLPTKPSIVPGVDPDPKTALITRYTRVNIFATKTVGTWKWYLVGPGQWLEQRRIAQVLPAKHPDGVKGRWVSVDLYEQVLTAYEDDRLVFATLISSGLPKWDTNEGVFHIWTRSHSTAMSGAMGRSDFYSLQAVPWVMYFDHDISLHGTYWHDGFGYRHSHGCVNMSITDAHWIFSWTDGFYFDTAVSVWSSHQYNT